MTAEEIKEAFRTIPAGPFTIHVAERTPIDVLHTDFAMVSPSGRTLVAYDTERHLHYIEADSVTRISHELPAERVEG
jgi:hypothetical protein